MGIFDNFMPKATSAVAKVGETAKTALEERQLSNELKEGQRALDDQFKLLGAKVYELLEDSQDLPSFQEERRQIHRIYKNQLEVQKKLDLLKSAVVRCEACEAVYPMGTNFCPNCGAKNEMR